MKTKIFLPFSCAAALILALGVLFTPLSSQAQGVSETAMAGGYSVNLKVLPAESFTGPHAEMARDRGAEADLLGGPGHPNHHMVAFIRRDGEPVQEAKVSISYRKLSPKIASWMTLPVARMHVAGHGLETTHFGNNVMLGPGKDEVRVSVDGSKPATFRFSLQR